MNTGEPELKTDLRGMKTDMRHLQGGIDASPPAR